VRTDAPSREERRNPANCATSVFALQGLESRNMMRLPNIGTEPRTVVSGICHSNWISDPLATARGPV